MAFQDVLAYHQPKQGYGNWQEIQIRTIFKISFTEAMHIGGCERILFHCSILRVPSLHAFDPFAKATTKAKKLTIALRTRRVTIFHEKVPFNRVYTSKFQLNNELAIALVWTFATPN